MADFLALLQQNPASAWLRHPDGARFDEYFFSAYERLPKPPGSTNHLRVALAESDPVRFLACFCAIHTAGHSVFFCNSRWGHREWQQVQAIVRPQLIVGNCPLSPKDLDDRLGDRHPLICIPTGGTSGEIKFASHTWETLTHASQAFQQHFDRSSIRSFCLLPLFHVSGFMQFVRSLLSGGELFIGQSKQFLSSNYRDEPAAGRFISLVPTQLRRALSQPDLISWLGQCEAILLGGAPAWPSLLEQARKLQLPLSPTYGATETAAQVATLLPHDFLKGEQSGAPVLPHACIRILDEGDRPLPPNTVGRIAIRASSLALGYFPEIGWSDRLLKPDGFWISDDIGYLDHRGSLHVMGRSSHKILTGGESVFPTDVELAIRDTQLVEDVAVLGLPDEDWGEVVVAVCVLAGDRIALQDISQLLTDRLAPYKLPRRWLASASLPRNSRGKIDRQRLRDLAGDARCL